MVGGVGGTARANRPPLRPFRSPGASKRYLLGLLGRVERKNGWQLAEAIGKRDPQGACRAAARRRVVGGASRPGRRWRQTPLGVGCVDLAPDPEKGMRRWLLVHRSTDDPEDRGFYKAYGPERTPIEEGDPGRFRNPPTCKIAVRGLGNFSLEC